MTDTRYDDPEFADELGRTIRLLRIDRRIDRRDLAEQAGISYSYLSAIENGSKAPSARLLYSLARALGMRDDELLATVRERLATAPETVATAPPTSQPPAATAAAPPPPAPAASMSTRARRGILGRRQGSGATDPRRELLEIVEQLDPADAEAVLEVARRLAGR